jgi:hypothetical protein
LSIHRKDAENSKLSDEDKCLIIPPFPKKIKRSVKGSPISLRIESGASRNEINDIPVNLFI